MKGGDRINNLVIIRVKCDCCGKMVGSYSDRSNWFGKYLKPEENKICHDCIKTRDGYAEEFLEKIGIPLDNLPSEKDSRAK